MNPLQKTLKTNKSKNGFIVVESLIAVVVSSIILAGSITILNKQIEISNKNKAILRIHEEIHYDSKSIKNYARLWNLKENIYLPENQNREFQEQMTYNSNPACNQFNRTGTFENSARSDFHNFHTYFPYMPDISRNNVVISSFSYDNKTFYKVKRSYIIPSQSSIILEEKPYTIRVNYTVETVSNNQTSTFPFIHNVDISLNAQYYC